MEERRRKVEERNFAMDRRATPSVFHVMSHLPIIRSNTHHHEEPYVTNPNDLILLNYRASTSIKQPKIVDPLIATYELNYRKGKVIALGIYSEDIIAKNRFNKYFDSLLVKYAASEVQTRRRYLQGIGEQGLEQQWVMQRKM